MKNYVDLIGNKDLLKLRKTAFLAPNKISTLSVIRCFDWAQMMCSENRCVVSGFSSRLEKEVLHFLLKGEQPIIMVLGRKMYSQMPEELKIPIEQGRLLIISLTNDVRQSRRNAYLRNCYIAKWAEEMAFPCIPPTESSLYCIYEKLIEEKRNINILSEMNYETKAN